MAFQVGDKIQFTGPPQKRPLTVREIVDVFVDGYGWKYPDVGAICPSGHDNYFLSQNSNDPTLIQWVKI